MATKYSNTLSGTNNTDAEFRAWAQFIHDTFTLASSWVDTLATGSVDLTTVTRPLATQTTQGFKVYRMDDALQATVPVFLKMEFGSGAAALNPAIWITIGSGHNGSGTITGLLKARTQIAATAASAATTLYGFGSAGNNRVTFSLFPNSATSTVHIGLSVERTKNSSGADTNEGLLVMGYGGAITSTLFSHFIPFTGIIPVSEVGLAVLLTAANPSNWDSQDMVAAPVFFGTMPKQPGTNLIVCRQADFGSFSRPLITMYGVQRTYQHLGTDVSSVRHTGGGSATDSLTRLMIRFD